MRFGGISAETRIGHVRASLRTRELLDRRHGW